MTHSQRKALSDFSAQHSVRAAALLALCCAAEKVFPDSQRVSCRVSEVGFTASFVFPGLIDEEALALLAREMHALFREAPKISAGDMLQDNAAEYFFHQGQHLRAAQLSQGRGGLVPIARVHDFLEVITPPFPEGMGVVGAFKLLTHETAERLFNEDEVHVVTTITGTAFSTSKELKAFLKLQSRAASLDHRRLGRELQLYDTNPLVGAGCWMWYPKGSMIRHTLLDWWRSQHQQQGFRLVDTPRLVRQELLNEAGLDPHDYPSFDVQGIPHVMTPKTSPLHALVFRAHLHSYRELPLRYAECGDLVYHGDHDDLHGLCRSHTYSPDDAHVFCTPEQVVEILTSSLQFFVQLITLFGFRHRFCLRLRGQRFAGTLAQWRFGEACFSQALENCSLQDVDREEDCAYDGPKLEVELFDALGRSWSGPTVALDFATPERFGLRYQGDDDKMHTPILIDRSTFGSIERFVAILVEHFAGQFPLWLAPEQVRLLPVDREQQEYTAELLEICQKQGLRAEADWRHERLGAKVFAAESEKVPFIAIIGKAEVSKRTVTLRRQGDGRKGESRSIEAFLQDLQTAISLSQKMNSETHN